MRRRHQHNQFKKYERWIADGGGAAHGKQYIPFLHVRDFPSVGNVHRVKGWKTGRVHHFLSNLELSFFLLLEWCDAVTDINEQFALDLAETQAISQQLGFRHPCVPVTKETNIMTTDFKITRTHGLKETTCARAIKPSGELTKRTLQKLEIERRYWEKRNVNWAIVTERNIDQTQVRNIQWLHPHRELQPGLLPASISLSKVESLLHDLIGRNSPLADAALALDDRVGLPLGCGLVLVRHFLVTKRWRVDMDYLIDPKQPLKLLSIP